MSGRVRGGRLPRRPVPGGPGHRALRRGKHGRTTDAARVGHEPAAGRRDRGRRSCGRRGDRRRSRRRRRDRRFPMVPVRHGQAGRAGAGYLTGLGGARPGSDRGGRVGCRRRYLGRMVSTRGDAAGGVRRPIHSGHGGGGHRPAHASGGGDAFRARVRPRAHLYSGAARSNRGGDRRTGCAGRIHVLARGDRRVRSPGALRSDLPTQCVLGRQRRGHRPAEQAVRCPARQSRRRRRRRRPNRRGHRLGRQQFGDAVHLLHRQQADRCRRDVGTDATHSRRGATGAPQHQDSGYAGRRKGVAQRFGRQASLLHGYRHWACTCWLSQWLRRRRLGHRRRL